MERKLICIECPKGCTLTISVEDGVVSSVKGNNCTKGEIYAVSEVENPLRILCSSVIAEGLMLHMIPVRTDKPIPKHALLKGMEAVKRLKISRPVLVGDILVENFLGYNANLIVTRDCGVGDL